MDKHQSKIIIFLSLATSAIIVFFAFRQKVTPQINAAATPGPIPQAEAQAPLSSSVVSPDGKFELSLKQSAGKDSTSYSLNLMDQTSGAGRELLRDSLPNDVSLSIPLNTFSPDDKYVFLKASGFGGLKYFVLDASKTTTISLSDTTDFSTPFAVKYPNYVITEATGWAAPTLIVINVNKTDGSTGPSFWYDLLNKSYILLSERFN